MKRSTFYHLSPFQIYIKFIKKCQNKKYGKDIVLHGHHIIPKHVWNVPENKEKIFLSVNDHIKAHLLLAECFEQNSYEYNSNMRSARLLNSKSIRSKKILSKIRKTYSGKNNPFFGKKHSDATIKKIAEHTRKQCKNKKYDERYGLLASVEKHKRSIGGKNMWKNISEEDKSKRIQKASNSLKGKIPWNKGLSKDDPRVLAYIQKTRRKPKS